MSKIYLNNYFNTNLYKKKSTRSEIMTEMIYGDAFSIIKKAKSWIKIKIINDGYIGYIKKRSFYNYEKPTHKVSVLSAKIYKSPSYKNVKGKLTFGSKIKSRKKFKNFIKFNKGWISNDCVRPFKIKSKNFFSQIKIFKNIKYKWGGKTSKGIDCSGLVQVFLNFNNKYCPRDAKDQVKYFKKNINLNKIKKNDLIFWKGHVAIVLSKKKLIHAYGPMKKVVVMDINKTIKRIKETANLKVTKIKRIV